MKTIKTKPNQTPDSGRENRLVVAIKGRAFEGDENG